MKLIVALLFTLLMTATSAYAAGDPVRGAELSSECSDCHGADGMGNEAYPRLSGLEETYILEQLVAFKNGERPSQAEMMMWFLEDLDEQGMADLAAYYAARDNG